MPELKRNFFGGYYIAPIDAQNIFYGIEVYHSVRCGTFIDTDGSTKALMHYALCKDNLPDTQGKQCEMCDFALLYGDLDNRPIMAALMTDPASAMALVHPAVGALLLEDFAAGLDAFAIVELRAGVLVPEFLGFTLGQVLANRPDIYQPTIETLDPPQEVTTYDEHGEAVVMMMSEREIPNVWRCSLERE